MKLLIFTLIFVFIGCSDENSSFISCIQDDINRQSTFKLKLYEINSPNGKLYHLENNSLADNGEYIYDEKCNIICVTDCECEPTGIYLCPDWIFTSPRKAIWQN